ncbi:hypothetical protein [Staphylococcus agnetis]|uniref:hypothetical protein n=1 Tax=Staphylococcus agnetis TaxID=985762 RepID=UPI00115AB80D|nr:hypothetical protein [Staphylococcus agnetis]MBY7665444.1 hypothetical protein [Staphylococcus agnetis]NJH78429.1 hypothetical protein [Staphylococcus agnetis]TRW80803.1 hypothetical protein FNK43_08100 [Staphylococcus agnetis]
MKVKRLLGLILTSFVLLAGCNLFGEDDDKKAKSESHQKKENKEKKDKNKTKKEEKSTEETQTDNTTTETAETQKFDVRHVTDRATLEAILYGNYTEIEKIAAYNSAVANGVIPQGNVMEGPAAKAYESSLRIERGEERSIYEQHVNDNTHQASQPTERPGKVDLNRGPATGFTTEGMSPQAKKEIEDLTYQKDFEGLPQKEYNDRVSAIMNREKGY